MERREFFKSATAGIGAGLAAATTAAAAATTKGKPKRGVSVYCYSSTLGVCLTLEDCFADIHDMGATCFELLSSHIEGYPNPTTQWIDHYWGLCDKYKLQPAEMGMWAETHLHRGPKMTDDQIVAEVTRDIKLANMLGFDSLRFKITTINRECDPEPGWQSYMERLLPVAEKYDVAMLSECHSPTLLTRQHITDYLEFAAKHKSKYFGINADFGTFMSQRVQRDTASGKVTFTPLEAGTYSKPEDIIRILPTCRTCHAKFQYIDENFEDRTTPSKEVLQIMVDHGWNGQLVSEYEGPQKDDPGFLGDQLRRHHIMMQRILGY